MYSERVKGVVPVTKTGDRPRNIRLLVEYDGLPYHGWQVQPQGITVQEVLQDILRRITGEEIHLRAAGRTDAGVHALGQVTNFHTRSGLEAAVFQKALNGLAPRTVAILAAQEVPMDFDAQFSAVAKNYRYRLLSRSFPSALENGRVWFLPLPLDLGRMQQAVEHLRGRHDFSAFRSSGCTAQNTTRTLSRIEIHREGDLFIFDLEGDGFLRHMVRNIVGTLVEVGRGRFSPPDCRSILKARQRSRAGIAAPPYGLYLVSVIYPSAYRWET